MRAVRIWDMGLVDYKRCWDIQEGLNRRVVQAKMLQRKEPGKPVPERYNYLIFCEHPPVYTMGKSGKEENLLLDEAGLSKLKAGYYKINRGGDITHHGPGQLVMYPILDLERFFTDIHKFLRFLEEAVILTLAEFNISASRFDGYTGVWLDPDDTGKARKICAMGIRSSRWVTMHGIALNVNNDLSYFDYIVPCGIEDKQVTSMKKQLGQQVDMNLAKHKLQHHLKQLFEMEFI